MVESTCVFCGRPIADGEPMSGRAPHAAHATCADAALADDAHWDAVAAAAGGSEQREHEATVRPERPSTRGGCLAVIAIALPCLAVAGATAARLAAG